MTVVAALALAVVVATAFVAVGGVLLADDALDQLHFLGPLAHVGSAALVVASLATFGPGATTGRVAVVVGVLQVAAPVATHATARAGLVRGDVDRLRGHAPDLVE
ncbi:monovalent cation/H(+) antiporter subunit G [Egicoccus sp. AB-alg6-2]|uniref:monovalent cation/H(+) antiporter subunit G n=1 Tax=Egicoccus sp. AB-alg6-2 TaxID=3242692 RepID=UPI00359CF668